uniref:Large ribosomal subunit protein uL18c n=1 Tax=Lympha mucosa TaxID=2045360 RepID=A0A6B9VPD0_9FLOR|nr:ribosomal protein L18 [Lympha mucosa]
MKKKLRGTGDRPRLYVFRSNKHIYAQIIDDNKGQTLVTTSSISPEIRSAQKHHSNCEISKKVGESIAKKCIAKGITKIIFDRGKKLYHGQIKVLAESAREAGMHF